MSSDSPTPEAAPETATATPARRSVSFSVSTMAWTGVTTALGLTAITLAGFLVSAHSEISARDAADADNKHAEQIATDYAVGAATVNFADFNSWVGKLKANTTPPWRTSSTPPHRNCRRSSPH